MTDKAVDLDQHRGMAAQKATELRRLLSEVLPMNGRCKQHGTNSKRSLSRLRRRVGPRQLTRCAICYPCLPLVQAVFLCPKGTRIQRDRRRCFGSERKFSEQSRSAAPSELITASHRGRSVSRESAPWAIPQSGAGGFDASKPQC